MTLAPFAATAPISFNARDSTVAASLIDVVLDVGDPERDDGGGRGARGVRGMETVRGPGFAQDEVEVHQPEMPPRSWEGTGRKMDSHAARKHPEFVLFVLRHIGKLCR